MSRRSGIDANEAIAWRMNSLHSRGDRAGMQTGHGEKHDPLGADGPSSIAIGMAFPIVEKIYQRSYMI